MSRKAGFTLVELLVVISIIAILISIMVPTFAMVKEITKSLVCLNNLHIMGIAIHTYAGTYEGRVPPYVYLDEENSAAYSSIPGFDLEIGDMVPVSTPYCYQLAFDNCCGDPHDLAPGNMGYCYREGLIENPDAMYCPAKRKWEPKHPKTPEIVGFRSPEDYVEPWGEYYPGPWHRKDGQNYLNRKGFVAIGYAYNPIMEGRVGLNGLPRYHLLDDFPPDEVIMMDMQLSYLYWVPHVYRGNQWNLLFAGNHTGSALWNEVDAFLRLSGHVSQSHSRFADFIMELKLRMQ